MIVCVKRQQTCVVGRVVVGVQELFDGQSTAEQRVLGNGVQISLQSPLPLCNELPVHVSDQFLWGKWKNDPTHLQREREVDILSFTVSFV